MFDKGHQTYCSDIELGKRYKDPQTGIEGVATSVYFFQYACERVALEFVNKDGNLQTEVFDSPRLECMETKKRARSERTGGPGDRHEGARPQGPGR